MADKNLTKLRTEVAALRVLAEAGVKANTQTTISLLDTIDKLTDRLEEAIDRLGAARSCRS